MRLRPGSERRLGGGEGERVRERGRIKRACYRAEQQEAMKEEEEVAEGDV